MEKQEKRQQILDLKLKLYFTSKSICQNIVDIESYYYLFNIKVPIFILCICNVYLYFLN